MIGLGSNLGDRQSHLDLAVARLSETPDVTVRRVSRRTETNPVGGPPGQPAFLNAAAVLETNLGPGALLNVLNSIEALAGRLRTTHWGERTLDLDLLLFDDRVIHTPDLTIPHPRMALRRFVLAPLAEIAPEAVDPLSGRTVSDLLAGLDRRPSYVAIASVPPWNRPDTTFLRDRLQKTLPALTVETQVPETETDVDIRIDLTATCLDASTLASLTPPDGWIVSHFWFDALFLSPDPPRSVSPRSSAQIDRALRARARILPPTFAVARRVDLERLGRPHRVGCRAAGWDVPLLEVDTFDDEATVAEVLTTCAATRTG